MAYATRCDFDIFAKIPVQNAVLSSRVTHYKPITPLDQSDLEFVTPGDAEKYVDLVVHLSVRGNLVAQDVSSLDPADSTTVVKNLLNSLQSVQRHPNGFSISSSKDLYNYRVYLETPLSYGRAAAQTHLTSTFCYPDEGDFIAHNPSSDTFNRGYEARWKIMYNSAWIEMYERVYPDLFNVPRLLPHGVQLQPKFTKSKTDLYVLSSKADTGAVFRFLEATLHVR